VCVLENVCVLGEGRRRLLDKDSRKAKTVTIRSPGKFGCRTTLLMYLAAKLRNKVVLINSSSCPRIWKQFRDAVMKQYNNINTQNSPSSFYGSDKVLRTLYELVHLILTICRMGTTQGQESLSNLPKVTQLFSTEA
jgi:hypothetical protein